MTTSESSRLSALQLLMREWSALAPYNFIHAMRLPGPADVARWQVAVTATTDLLPIPGHIDPIEQPGSDLETHFQTELHRPFSSGASPIRFFVIEDKPGGHWFGVVVDHWVFDDFSCRALLQRIYSVYQGSADGLRLEWTPPMALGRRRWREWLGFVKQARRLRRAWRTPFHDPTDLNVRAFRKILPESTLDASRSLAKEQGATLHDLFLAATAQAFGAARKWESGMKRDAVAIASAMDLRRFEPESGRNRLGLLVSHYIIMERRPDERSLGDLSRRIAAYTLRMKSTPGTDVVPPTLLAWRWSRSRRAKATFFSRGAPLVAGLSNVNLTGSWIEHSEITDFRRIGPTGPIVPMVLMITTVRGRISFDVTYRATAFTPAEANRLVEDIIQRLPGNTA